MTDSDMPDDQPHYIDRCEEMGFDPLRRFIHDRLESSLAPADSSNEDLPRSEKQFLNLCDMLSAKAKALKQGVAMPKRPTYEGPRDPGREFTPSGNLKQLYTKRNRADRRFNYEKKHGDSEIYIGYLADELVKAEQEIAPVEEQEGQEYNKRLRKYEEAHDPHMDRVRLWSAEVDGISERRRDEAKRDAIVERARRKVKRAFGSKRASDPNSISTLPWELAAPGERTDDHVRWYYREVLGRGRLHGFSQDRLDKMLALPRSDWQKGRAGFYGYIVLMFAHTEKVLMECPVYNNAIYVLDSGEERLLKMNKQELIASGETKRIFHVGDWYQRLKKELGI